MKTFSAVLTEEDGGYVSLCTELDIASQGETIEEAISNLKEAVEGSVPMPMHKVVKIGTLQSIIRQSGVPREACAFSR